MSKWCTTLQLETWAYCLKPNHIHLIVVPETKDGLNIAIGEAHRRCTRRINFREGWPGAFIALSQKHERTGRFLGVNPFNVIIELLLDRKLKHKNLDQKKISKVSPELV